MKKMRPLRRFFTAALAAAMMLILSGLTAFGGNAEENEPVYMENEWNFVEGSMDISGGIPENAIGVLGDIREAGKLRVITEPYFAPQEFLDPEKEGQAQYAGADMELARLIALRMGVELEIIPMEFTEVLGAVAARKGDLAISALSYTPGRAASYELSKGYYFAESDVSSGVLIRKEDEENIRSIEDLKNRTLMAQRGSLQESMAAEAIRTYLEFRRVSTISEVYEGLKDGSADAAVVDLESAQSYLDSEGGADLMFVEGIAFRLEEAYKGDRIAGRKGELELMYFVNGVIDEVNQKGLYTQWMEEARKRAAELGL